jgi:hypothetical protein
MDHYGWQVAGGLIVAIASWIVGRVMAPKNDCSKCGLAELKKEIERLCKLVRVLADRVKMSAKEQLEIESME